MNLIKVTDETTRAEIAEALQHLRRSRERAPRGGDWDEVYHRRVNVLLDAYEKAPA